MSRNYGAIAFTPAVRQVQAEHGSRRFYERKLSAADGGPSADALTDVERTFLADRDSFYLATVSESGWPYVQYRGGPRGFLRALDEHTLAWADFRGNLQFISTGNLAGDDRVALIAVDHAQRERLKIFGRARVIDARSQPAVAEALVIPGYDAVVERAVVVDVVAFDWNCQQHIAVRYSPSEVEQLVGSLREDLVECRRENEWLQSLVHAGSNAALSAQRIDAT
jgi:predicted pyridoxine 5'-phosphate oxidase superfamily flavin-nucleotide-binding protein